MNIEGEQICRLCLKVVENDFERIDEITREMFQVLLNVNLEISKDPIVCNDCRESLIKFHDFKSACIDTEERKFKFSLALDNNTATLEPKDLLKHERDNLICRFCSNYSSRSDFVSLDTLMNDVTFAEAIRALVPVMDFNVIKNSVICTTCRQDLQFYGEFVQNCLDVENKISKYCRSEGILSSTQVKLSEVVRFLTRANMELDYTHVHAIKPDVDVLEDVNKAHLEVYDEDLIKTEDATAMDVKYEKINYNETASNMPTCQSNIFEFNAKHEIVSTQNSLFAPTTTDYEKCACDPIHQRCIKCDAQSNVSPKTENHSETLVLKEFFETKPKDNVKIDTLIQTSITDPETYQCSTCTYRTKRKGDLKGHMLIHRDIAEAEKDLYKCSECTFETKRKIELIRHNMLTHNDRTEVETYKCLMCTFEAKRKIDLIKHVFIHQDTESGVYKIYNCSACSFKTNFKMRLTSHKLIHNDVGAVEIYKCSTCTYRTKRKGDLKGHMLCHKNATEVEMYKCSMCAFQTKRKGNLNVHKVLHKDVKEVEMYKCSKCTFETRHKGNLKSHMVIHEDTTNMKMYKCSVCTFETKHKGYLKTHILVHKNVADVEMYKCSTCAFQSRLKSNLKRHTSSHKGITEAKRFYECPTCSFQTKFKNSLKRHMSTHKDI